MVRVSEAELKLVTPRLTYTLRCGADAPPRTMRRWFDELLVRMDELRRLPPPPEDEQEEEAAREAADEGHEPWHRPPATRGARLLWGVALPLKGAIHCTVPDVMQRRWAEWYVVTIGLAVAWLALLAYVMNLVRQRVESGALPP